MSELTNTLEALLFLSSEPVSVDDLAVACDCETEDVRAAFDQMAMAYAPGERGLVLRELAGGWTLVTAPETEAAARRLLAKPRTPPLTPAQAETLAIVAYLQPVSRPEITRIRGVAADSAAGTLLERGLIEEAGRSPFGAVLLRTTALFLKLFGLNQLADLPEPGEWDPTPEEEGELRDRLLKAGDARLGGPAAPPQPGFEGEDSELASPSADAGAAGAFDEGAASPRADAAASGAFGPNVGESAVSAARRLGHELQAGEGDTSAVAGADSALAPYALDAAVPSSDDSARPAAAVGAPIALAQAASLD